MTTISTARQNSIDPPALIAALAMLKQGLRPVPLKIAGLLKKKGEDGNPDELTNGKEPHGNDWGSVRHTETSLRDYYRKYPGAGVGILLGANPDPTDPSVELGVIDLEIDDPELAAPVLGRIFGEAGIPGTLGFGSNRGGHYLFRFDARLAKYLQRVIKGYIEETEGEGGEITSKVKGNPNYVGVEFRIGTIDINKPAQLQSVIPPTLKEDGTPREWKAGGEVLGTSETVINDLWPYILPLPECVYEDLDKFAHVQSQNDHQEKAALRGSKLSGPTLTNAGGGANWDKNEVKAALLPHVRTLAERWGVVFTGKSFPSTGFLECHGIRKDNKASAGLNVQTGVFNDFGDKSYSIFDLGLALGQYPDFNTMVNELGREFGVQPKSTSKALVSPQEKALERSKLLNIPGLMQMVSKLVDDGKFEEIFGSDATLMWVARMKETNPGQYVILRNRFSEKSKEDPRFSVSNLDKAVGPLLRDAKAANKAELMGRTAKPTNLATAEDDGENPYVGDVKAPADYRHSDVEMTMVTEGENGQLTEIIARFYACIAEELTWDDGSGETKKTFKVQALSANSPVPKVVEIPATEFERMAWVVASLGPDFRIEAGRGIRDHVRSAIQQFSADRIQRTIYTATGWRSLDRGWTYLHGGGGISAAGNDPSISVEVQGNGRKFHLPDPPRGERRSRAIRASLDILGLADPESPGSLEATATLFAMTYRSVIQWADFAGQFHGGTGSLKSSLAALGQQHFGPLMNAKNLPASWVNDTALAIGDLSTKIGDSLLIVDDYVPRGSSQDIARKQHEVQTFIQSIGNHAGRARLNQDGSPRPSKPPNCLPISTGEDQINAGSADARTLPIRFTHGMINKATLKLRQANADSGLYAESMASYIEWLAPQLDQVRAEMNARVLQLRDELFIEGDHARTPEIVAHLIFGAEKFLHFALEVEAIDRATHDTHRKNIVAGLKSAASEIRADRSNQPDPCELFIDLIRSALSSGDAYLSSSIDNASPDGMEVVCGWQVAVKQRGKLDPVTIWERGDNADQIGWTDGETVFLEPDVAYAKARELASKGGQGFPMSARSLKKALHEQGKIDSRYKFGSERKPTSRLSSRVTIRALKTQYELLPIPVTEFWSKTSQDLPEGQNVQDESETGPIGSEDSGATKSAWPETSEDGEETPF
ncbi:MAG: bifunctional DNA primase/polymerase [Acidimicrobiales bacterium]